MSSSAADKECKGCYHPRPRDGVSGYAIAKLGVMRQKSHGRCITCAILFQGIQTCVPSVESLGDDELVRIEFNSRGTRSLEVWVFSCSKTVSFFIPDGKASLMTAQLLPDCPRGYDIPGATSSTESLAWISSQLQRCEKSHRRCSWKSSSGSALPMRVLDVGRHVGDIVRLYETERETAQYACLSYCWGRSPFLRTVAANLKDHLEQISLDQLPLAQRETIAIVRQLGIRYLWIDSLCIIQDSKDDWRREAADMASIYQRSCLVISASKSSAACDGLFSTVPPDCFDSHKLVVDVGDGQQYSEVSARLRFTHISRPIPAAKENLSPLPVFTRGWTFQERFLAPRILHFNAEELAWECLEESACQCSGVESRSISGSFAAGRAAVARTLDKYATSGVGSPAQSKVLHNPSHWPDMTEQELRQAWHNLVEDHSCLDLTYEGDVFPATSGLAKQLQSVRHSRYLAGLWEKSLLADLCWHVRSHRNPDTMRHRPTHWRAPTWSWASVTGCVSFTTADNLLDPCDVLEATCIPAGADLTGELTSGYLLLRGLLVPTNLGYKPRKAADAPGEAVPPWRAFDLGILRGRMGNQYADCGAEMGVEGGEEETVGCFLLGRARSTGTLCFLVLRRVHGDDDGGVGETAVYERVGLAEVFSQQMSNMRFGLEQAREAGEEVVIKIV